MSGDNNGRGAVVAVVVLVLLAGVGVWLSGAAQHKPGAGLRHGRADELRAGDRYSVSRAP